MTCLITPAYGAERRGMNAKREAARGTKGDLSGIPLMNLVHNFVLGRQQLKMISNVSVR